MRKWLIVLVMMSTVALAASTVYVIPNIIAGVARSGEATKDPGPGRLGHIEFVAADSVKHREVEVSPGVSGIVTDVSGTLLGNSNTEPFVVYANRLGPFVSGKLSWKVDALSPAGMPISITIIENGNSVWTSCFSPTPKGYILRDSPVFEVSGEAYIVVANNNDAEVTYGMAITHVAG